MLPWMIMILVMLVFVLMLCCIKVGIMRRSCKEMEEQLGEHLTLDTNTQICVSSHDRYMRGFVGEINRHMKELRRQKLQYINGNQEIRDAVTNVAHDLRTPLTAIQGYLDLLEREEKSETVKRYISYIAERTDALTHLTEELFQYSVTLAMEEEPLLLEDVCVNHALENSIAGMYGAFAERGIHPQINICENKIVRKLNRENLQRVIENILSNALKYSVSYLIITLTEEGRVLFSNDTEGLTEVQVAKLFHRFFTVDDSRKSTGLGLAIAKTRMEQMNGTIGAKLENDRLTIWLQFKS